MNNMELILAHMYSNLNSIQVRDMKQPLKYQQCVKKHKDIKYYAYQYG